MVIGNGMVAKRFAGYKEDEDFLIFASGVSNSKNKEEADYLREYNLLADCIAKNPDKTFVYLSTTSVNDPQEAAARYITFKLSIEQYIAAHAKKYVIFRVSNLVGISPNPHTVLNFFVHHIKEGIPFNLWENASRNIIDVDDFFLIADQILRTRLFLNSIVHVANTCSYTVKQIVNTIETFCHKKAAFVSLDKGADYTIDVSDILPVIKACNINFDDDYLLHLLNKYYLAR
jgi:nucleoside-diphosphate-sugar epimerase